MSRPEFREFAWYFLLGLLSLLALARLDTLSSLVQRNQLISSVAERILSDREHHLGQCPASWTATLQDAPSFVEETAGALSNLAASTRADYRLKELSSVFLFAGHDERAAVSIFRSLANERQLLLNPHNPLFWFLRSREEEQLERTNDAIKLAETGLSLPASGLSSSLRLEESIRLLNLYRHPGSRYEDSALRKTLCAAVTGLWSQVRIELADVDREPVGSDNSSDQTLAALLGAWLSVRLGDLEGEREWLESAGPVPVDGWNKGDAYLWLASRLEKLRPWSCEEGTLQIYSWYSSHHPDDPQGPYLCGLALLQRCRFRESQERLLEALRRQPGNTDAMRALGLLFETQGQFSFAELWLKKAIAGWPKNADYHARLARVLEKLGETRNAAQEFRSAMELDPNQAEFRAWAGWFYLNRGDAPRARVLLRGSFTLRPSELCCRGWTQRCNRNNGKDAMMKRVLVTGVGGFIGSHVAERCLNHGFHVVGADDLSGGFLENVPEQVEFRLGNLVDPEFVRSLWTDGPFDFVYHIAAYAAEGLSHFIRRFNYQTNVIASVNLINASVLNKVKCFVFTSSIAVYGKNQTPMTEDMLPRPEDPYGISKYAVELDLAAALEMFSLPYVVFRPHNVYGERQNIADKYRNVIGIFMNQLMSGKPMTVFGDGTQTRAFSYVDEIALTIARAPLTPAAYGQVFNVGADTPYSILQLAAAVARALAVEPKLVHLPARKEVLHAFSSHRKVQEVFGMRRSLGLEEGLQRMADWARNRGAAKPVDFGEIEIPVNLPVSWRRKEAGH